MQPHWIPLNAQNHITMNVPFLFHVYDQQTSLAHVLVWHTPSWVTGDEDCAEAECNAAYGLRPTAAEEARIKGMRMMYEHAKTCKNSQLDAIAGAASGLHSDMGWELIMVGGETNDFAHLRNFIPLSSIGEKTIATRITVDVP